LTSASFIIQSTHAVGTRTISNNKSITGHSDELLCPVAPLRVLKRSVTVA
jgi:hypothetical protein